MPPQDPGLFELPKTPVSHTDFISYINKPGVKGVQGLVAPFNAYEAKLREGFAQHRDHQALRDPYVNAVPIFGDDSSVPRVHARVTDDPAVNERYIMPLTTKDRKPDGAPATVGSLHDFRKNFNLFSESSLADLDWSNVVAAGSSVVTAMLPIPDKYNSSKKALREYYHQNLAPSSDVDLFIWGLDEAAAIEKIKKIESSVRNAILEEVTTVRTKNAITIASHYPIRHVQIVLRLYKSVSEILTGFDVDCSCFAYDGQQVYASPRAIAAFMTQTNTIDLSRRSPSYESRLSKYARRGFEIFWPDLDRSRVDPTIFERSFPRTVGLARLLVLEQLPKPSDREDYLTQRRAERGRPSANTYWNRGHALPNNVKDQDPDDVAEWVYDDEISNYHSFTIPYGPKYHAKKIEKLLYTKDLLLNAEWNHKRNRTVNLHRHPCFIGPIESVIHDCCGCCPEPKTNEELETAEDEGKIYVSGDLVFMKDDPGRQTIGSFNPLTNDDWTEMAYIGNTQELCQKICDGDIAFVKAWCRSNPDSIDRRDHTGRTPLHVAAQSSTPEVLECLVDYDARIVARLVDGMTALHIAAARGSTEMVTTLLEQSEENEAREAEKGDKKSLLRHEKTSLELKRSSKDDDADDDSGDAIGDEDSSDEDMAITEGSFVNITKKTADEDALDDAKDAEPDVYDVNVVAWDTPVSPLHLAILGGHLGVIEALISNFGADVLLPVKIVNAYSRNPEHAIMTLVLAAQLAGSTSQDVTKGLLALGASSAQGDMNRVTAFHYLTATRKVQLLNACLDDDGAAARTALNHLVLRNHWSTEADNPLTTAIKSGDLSLVDALLDFGAKPIISQGDYAAAYSSARRKSTYSLSPEDEVIEANWKMNTEQSIFLAMDNDMPEAVLRMVDAGIDVNAMDGEAYRVIADFKDEKNNGRLPVLRGSLLDNVQARISKIKSAIVSHSHMPVPPTVEDDYEYLATTASDSYEHWYHTNTLKIARNVVREWQEDRNTELDYYDNSPGREQKLNRLSALQNRFEVLRDQLLQKGAKTFRQLYPHISVEIEEDKELKDATTPGKPFEPKLTFHVSTTDDTRDGYHQLFEAAWNGDNAKITQLTLSGWGPDQKYNPLKVTTRDGKGFTPFHIAAYRRQYGTAKVLLEIANAQFKDPDENTSRRRYIIAEADSDYSSDNEGDDLEISSQLVDETFTIDNIATLRQTVGSRWSASDMLIQRATMSALLDLPEYEAQERLGVSVYDVSGQVHEGRDSTSILGLLLERRFEDTTHFGRYALVSRDLELYRFWLRCLKDASKMKTNSCNDSAVSGYLTSDFQFALQHGFIEELREMITIMGAELPLDAFVQQSGVQDEQKPKYYQGLSIGGKKMTAWARERSGDYQQKTDESIPPLLQAAFEGGLAAVEWFLSDTPFRLYNIYGVNNADDHRLKMLAKAHGGLDQAVSSWLKRRSHLSLHASILSNSPRPASLQVLKYLLSVFPSAIDTRASCHSLTPLALSFLQGRTDAASTLIAAGADQTTRDASSKNLIHLALISISKDFPTDTATFRSLLSILDKRLLPGLFTERCRDSPGGLTPLGFWLTSVYSSEYYWHVYPDARLVPEILTIMLEFGGAEALTMMDGSGQSPLHQAVKKSYTGLVELMLDHDPALLSRENAMGQTPLELAESLYVRDCTKGNPDIRRVGYWKLEDRPAEGFVDEWKDSLEEENDVRKTWRICKEFAKKKPRGRKLVSVAEAREVARRLAERNKEKKRDAENGTEEAKIKETKDEVDGWLGSGALEMN